MFLHFLKITQSQKRGNVEVTPCKNCRALEFISDGIRKGNIMNIKLYEPKFNCALENSIVVIEGKPFCKIECKDKTTRVIK